jgi:hypothetical protein
MPCSAESSAGVPGRLPQFGGVKKKREDSRRADRAGSHIACPHTKKACQLADESLGSPSRHSNWDPYRRTKGRFDAAPLIKLLTKAPDKDALHQ